MDLDLYKEFYDREWERHEHLLSAVNTPISILTLLAGGLVLMGKGFESDEAILQWSFWIAMAISAGLVSLCVYLVVRSVHGYRYHRIPLPTELALHYETLKEHYNQQRKPGLTDPAFEKYITDRYIAAADRNAVNNIKRDGYLYLANRVLVLAICSTASTGIPAAIAVKRVRPRPQEVWITNFGSKADEILETRKAGSGGAAPRATRRQP
jgi:hypothetical protein